jgi:hypothetical protein
MTDETSIMSEFTVEMVEFSVAKWLIRSQND